MIVREITSLPKPIYKPMAVTHWMPLPERPKDGDVE